jgi:hypothetical protein
VTARDYSSLTREQLEARLDVAEDVCVMYAWSPATTMGPAATDRDKAAHELWVRWEHAGGDSSREANAHLTDELVSELARQRDATRARTLARIRLDGRIPDLPPGGQVST